jgi:DNA-binding beta-propeller fold protein YncE
MGGSIQGTPLSLAAAAMDITSIQVSTIAGTPGIAGTSDMLSGSFYIVNGITTDGDNIYVTDYGNHTIRKIDIKNNVVSTIAGLPGAAGSTDSAYGVPTFYNPTGITTDGLNLYVADYNNHTIRQIVIKSGAVSTIAGLAGYPGSVDDSGVFARFNHPTDVTTDGKNLYVTDTGNLTIRKVSLTAPYAVTTVAGVPGIGGASDGPLGFACFQYPSRITMDGTYLYVTDFIKNTIRRIDTNGYVTTIVGTPGLTGSSDGIGAAARFSNINGITSDGTNLYVTDSNNHTVRMIDKNGNVKTIAGSPNVSGSGGETGATARFRFPVGITTDGKSLYVTDSNNYTIRKITGGN